MPELVLIITGIVILIASVIFFGNDKHKEGDSSFSPEKLADVKKDVITYAKKSMETVTEEAIVEADDTMSKISNEKIMALNEFSDVTLAKIQENHDHVVFLYNMLNTKDEEIKKSLSEIENAKHDLKDTVGEVVKITRQLNQAVKKNQKAGEEPSFVETQKNVAAAKSTQTKPKTVKEQPVKKKVSSDPNLSMSAVVDAATGQMNLPEMMKSDNKNEEILRLYREGRSILDISKMLNKGQGEVKLVIDLYGA